MRVIPSDKVEVHLIRPAGRAARGGSLRGGRFLLLRRSPGRRTLAGVWQPVTGGIERGETAWQAARREVREETGLEPVRWWALEHLSIYYEARPDACVVLPVFAAELARDATPRLSHEHDAWILTTAAVARRRVLWDAQRHAIDAVVREILSGRPAARVRDITALVNGGARRARGPRSRAAATRRRVTPSIRRGA
ncbi:MAG TPA: NUDIX pyrophosphatase [Dongiaceae bacterium]|nr:NUDIX pyrophosphatase [Dongiaceae bacterium]